LLDTNVQRRSTGMRRIVASITATLVLTVVAAAGPATAPAAPEKQPVDVQIIGTGDLLDGGTVLEVRALIRCEPVGEVLEALVTASQDDNAISGQGFFVSGVTCDGRPHIATGRIQLLDEQTFHPGQVHVSAFVLLLNPETGETFSGQDTREVNVH
jgi:hypothetical protein